MTTDESKLYDLICRSYIAQFYPSYEYDKTSIEINASGEMFNALNIFLRLTSVTNWCAFFIALINAPSLYLAGGFVCFISKLSLIVNLHLSNGNCIHVRYEQH
jgi:hypothetical protein